MRDPKESEWRAGKFTRGEGGVNEAAA